jgi:predicted metal-dependent peptidase
MTSADLSLKLDRARWWLLANQPFYGSLAMALPDVMGNPHGKTACTDAKRIFWDRDFLAKLSDEETRGVLAHETLHNAHGHFWRFPKADERTQQACDYAINGTLTKVEGIKLPAGCLLNPSFDGLAEEEIYNCLPEPPKGGSGKSQKDDPCGAFTDAPDGSGEGEKPGKEPGNKPGEGQGQGGDEDGDGNGQGDGSGESLKSQWEEKVIQAAQAAKASGRGSIPADMQRVLDRTLKQRVDWRREMADFVKDAAAVRNDWSRAARRMATQPVIYPRKRRDDLGLIIFVRDTSGSIDDKLCAEFTGLIANALGETGCRGLVIDCDADIHREQWIDAGGDIDPRASGGGGTDFRPPFERAAVLADEGERIAGLVYLTDLMGPQPDSNELPTLWLCTTDTKADSGRTVKIET